MYRFAEHGTWFYLSYSFVHLLQAKCQALLKRNFFRLAWGQRNRIAAYEVRIQLRCIKYYSQPLFWHFRLLIIIINFEASASSWKSWRVYAITITTNILFQTIQSPMPLAGNNMFFVVSTAFVITLECVYMSVYCYCHSSLFFIVHM